MKKSEIYKYAQVAVLETEIRNSAKLEILRVLMTDEDLALYAEEQKAKRESETDETV